MELLHREREARNKIWLLKQSREASFQKWKQMNCTRSHLRDCLRGLGVEIEIPDFIPETYAEGSAAANGQAPGVNDGGSTAPTTTQTLHQAEPETVSGAAQSRSADKQQPEQDVLPSVGGVPDARFVCKDHWLTEAGCRKGKDCPNNHSKATGLEKTMAWKNAMKSKSLLPQRTFDAARKEGGVLLQRLFAVYPEMRGNAPV